ncbi:MAG: prolyl oligopeptidase family serine peptidase [Betaproteobacteria bacterium]|nr:prolyl oligopeptidase family serine peptidase [Betaproteobacteria bacterium]
MAGSRLPEGELAFTYFPESYRWSHGLLIALGGAPWGGGEIDEINRIGLRLRNRVGDDVAWFNEWAGEAERLENIGHSEAGNGHALTAAAYLFRAAHYYHVGERFMQPKTAESQTAYRRGVDAFRKAAGVVRRPRIEHVEVPYEGTSLPGIIVHADAVPGRTGQGPVMLFLDGFDVTKEIQYFRGVPDLAARGVSCLILDGPGNGEAIRFRNLPLHHETERHAGAAYDYLASRPEFDPQRIGIMALSLGGYYAPRAASMDHRFACCISWGPEWDYHTKWKERLARIERGETLSLSVPWQHLLWVFGVKTKEEAFTKLEGFKLDGVVQKMKCPYLLVYGEGDQQAPFAHAQKTIEAAGSQRKELKIFTREEGGYHHCQVDNVSIGTAYMWDWVVDVLKPQQ